MCCSHFSSLFFIFFIILSFFHFSSLFFTFPHVSSFFFTFLHFSAFFFTFPYFSLLFFIFLHFSSFFFIFLHFSSIFFLFLRFLLFFFTFLHFFQLFNIVEKNEEKWLQNQDFFPCAICVCVCIRHLRWHVDRHLCFAVTFLHLSPLFSTFLRFSHFLHFSSRGNTTGRGSTAGNEKCHVYEFMKLKLETCHCVTYSNFNHVVSCNKLCSESASTHSLVQNLCFANFCNSFSTKKNLEKISKISLQ